MNIYMTTYIEYNVYLSCFLNFSLGCGIGYGYLHRIPKRQFPSSGSVQIPLQAPNAAPADGFSEVMLVSVVCSIW